MRARASRKLYRIGAITLVVALMWSTAALACNGRDAILSDDPAADAASTYRSQNGISYLDDNDNLLFDRSKVKISPERAQAIAENFLKTSLDEPPLPLTFRKLEYVHGRLVYQFESQPIDGFNGKYHLGPVNFIVDRAVLDVDAMTGNLNLASGCGAAPGQLLYTHDFNRPFPSGSFGGNIYASNNTNFIARETGNKVVIDGIIDEAEWSDTGHRYFYLGDYAPHAAGKLHEKAQYHVEVLAQIDDKYIYFAVRTDTPTWTGLMFKDDPNLGMLAAYRDAKVMKSRGRITDRYFNQRPDKSFFLEKDEADNIVASASRQDEFYTYEFAVPLRSPDKSDVSFQPGKAYNMLLVVGNTLEHHGLFTLDDAHKDHDHSKSNKEHADVWASRETTLRIGAPADSDIFGNPVTATMAGYVSGFDPKKNGTHFHYAKPDVKEFAARYSASLITGAVLIAFVLAGLAIMLWRLGIARVKQGGEAPGTPSGVDLFRFGLIRRIAYWKHLRAAFIVPMVVVFAAIVVLGIMDVQDGRRNIATVYTWTMWWTLVIFSFVLLGRLWCMMCPFAAIGDFAQKIVSLNRRLPGWLRNMGLQTLGFIVLTLVFTLMAFESRPFVTAVVILIILAAAVVFSMIYERRSFCRHLCPVGAVIGLYSAVAPVELAPRSKAHCDAHARKTCAEACPMLEAPQDKDNGVYCNFCMKCLPACPNDNLSLWLKPFGNGLHSSRSWTMSEALASLFLLGVIIVETLSMTSVWQPLKNYAASAMGGVSDTAAYLVVFTIVVILPIGIFYGICRALTAWISNRNYDTMALVSEFAVVFIPLGVSLHFAHNLQHLFLEGGVTVPATLRLLDTAGIGSFFINWNPLPILGLKPIFFLQVFVIGGGLALTLLVLHQSLKRLTLPWSHLFKIASAMAVYALVVVLSNIYMLGLPMNGRHVH